MDMRLNIGGELMQIKLTGICYSSLLGQIIQTERSKYTVFREFEILLIKYKLVFLKISGNHMQVLEGFCPPKKRG